MVAQNTDHRIGEKLNDDAYVRYTSYHHFIEMLRNPRTGGYKGEKQSLMVFLNSDTVMYLLHIGLCILMFVTYMSLCGFGIKVLQNSMEGVFNATERVAQENDELNVNMQSGSV